MVVSRQLFSVWVEYILVMKIHILGPEFAVQEMPDLGTIFLVTRKLKNGPF